MPAVRYVSNEVVLEPDQWRVRVGAATVTPEPKVFELLCYLMRNPGRVVTKGELLDALWSGDVVGESVLTRCISCARKVLADDSKTPRFIRTFHGRGYEFIAPVSELGATEAGAQADSGLVPADAMDGDAGQIAERGFVGRRAEMQLLKEALRSAGNKPCDFILLSGEAGIGKTRLLDEATRMAPPGVDIHRGYCSPVEGAPPFLVWQQCFRSIVKAHTLKTVLRALSDSEGQARRLLLGTGRFEDNPAWDSASKRFRTFDSVMRALTDLARQRPLVLVLDDLHFADLGSLLLLEFLVQQRPPGLLILAAVRSSERVLDEARARTLGAIRALCRTELALSGLSADEVKQFVELKLERVEPGLAQSLHTRTGGNPFFLSVLTLPQGAPSAAEAALPSAVRQAISHRLSILEPACVELLRVASVCGREFEATVLVKASGVPVERCTELLQAGCSAGVVTATRAGEYRFVHDLMREVLYAEMGGDERSRAHLAVGRALEAIPTYQQARHAAMLAHHFAQGASLGGTTRAIDLSIRAGAYALRNFAYEEAIEQFTRASSLLSLEGEPDRASECALLLDLGLAQISAGQREAGRGTLTVAAAKARELGAVAELASVALGLSPGLFAIEVGSYDPILVELLREALAQVGRENDRLRALLLARLALALYWADTFEERVAICEEAKQLAERVGGDDVQAAVTTARALALMRPANLAERRVLSQEALELSGRASDHHGLLLNHLHRGALLLEEGDVAAAAFEAEAFQKLAQTVKQPQAVWIGRAIDACRLLLDGRLGEVEAIAGVCFQTGQRVFDHNALQTFGAHLSFVRIEQDRAAEILEVVRTYALSYPRTVAWRALYAYALSRSGQRAACAAEYESTKATGFELPDDLLRLVALALLSEVCHFLRDAEGAAILYDSFAPFSSRLVVVGFGIACLGSVERYLGLLAATIGRRDAAGAHFRGAIAANRRVHAIWPLAQTLYDYAIFIDETQGDRERALEHLREAEALARERNLVALLARIAAFPGR